MVIVIDQKHSFYNIDEFFHNAELQIQSLCYEFQYDLLLCDHQALMEGEGNNKVGEKLEKIKKFFVAIRQKIINLFNKTIDEITVISTKFADSAGKKIANNKLGKIDIDKNTIYDTAFKIAKDYGKDHVFYQLPYANVNDLKGTFSKVAVDTPVSDIMQMWVTTKADYKASGIDPDIVERIIADRAAYGDSTKYVQRDIKNIKDFRDDMLKSIEKIYKQGKLNGDSNEQMQRYQNFCNRTMKIYIAYLRCLCSNCKFRFAVYSETLNVLVKEN